MTENEGPHILVLGAGFGGLTFCQVFHHPTARVTLVDRQNHHLFQPLLYQVAAAGLSAPEIAQPIRSILADKPSVTVLMDNVMDFRLAEKRVFLEENTLSYDYLVLALGGVTSYFGHPEWEQFAPGLKSLDDAIRIRRHILLAFEKAETEGDPAGHDRLMTIVVVGGGPTGVELAGAFAELARTVLRKDFRRIDPGHARVILIEAAPRVLAHLSPELSVSAQQQLEALGVEVRTSTKVKNIRDRCVELEDGTTIGAENVIWAAGVSASPLTHKLGVELDRAGRVKVNPDLSFPGHLLRELHATPPFFRDPQTPRDYAVQAWVNGAWQDLVTVRDNYQRHRRHQLPSPVTTDKIRVVITATNGDPSAAIYEIRAYA